MSRLVQLSGVASSSRLSLESHHQQLDSYPNESNDRGTTGKYDISSLLTDPSSTSQFLPSLPSLSQNTYLPTQLTSLGTTFTSSGTLPRSSTPGGKTVAQRRSQAPPLVSTELRKVEKSEFESYLNEIRGEYDHWLKELRNKRNDDDEEEEEEEEDATTETEGGGDSPRKKKRGKTSRKKRTAEEALPPLDQVPPIFFDPSFNLSNPRTFDLVTERIQLTPSSSPSLTFSPKLTSPLSIDHHHSDPFLLGGLNLNHDETLLPGLGPSTLNELASEQLLQDKLSHFTAVIESHLVKEIGLRSSSFFSALSNLQQLHQQGDTTLSKISQLKSLLQDGENGVNGTARHGLEILRLQARRRGLERIEESVKVVEEVASALEGVKELVENGEWQDALEVAEQIQEAYYHSSSATSTSPPTPNSKIPPSSSIIPPSTTAASRGTNPAPTTPTPPPLNLMKLNALKSLPIKLSLIRAQIAKSLEGELISVLEHEMDMGIEAGMNRARRKKSRTSSIDQDNENENRGDIESSREGEAERIRERTRPVVKALVRSQGMDSAVQAWRESVLREVRAMVREHLPTGEGGDKDDEDPFASAAVRSVSKQSIDLGTISDKSLSLAKKLRAMSHEAFLHLARETYLGLIACIESVDLQATVLLELANQSREEERSRKSKRRTTNLPESETPNSTSTSTSLIVPGSGSETSPPIPTIITPTSPSSSLNGSDDASTLSTEITDVLTAVTELSNVRFSKVIGVRSEVHSQLALSEFLEIFDSTWSFVLECEVIVKRMIVGLRGAMVSQSKGWLMSFHQKRITDNAKLVEEEQWSASEVPEKIQRQVELIVKGAMVDPEELLLGQRRVKGKEGEKEERGEEMAMAKQVDIEGRQFFAVSAGLATIDTLVEYLQVVLNCPMLTTDAMSKVIEFMKVFNSRSCQVVLGAGAMRSAGLKNITAKNLALASQALSIMVSLIPYIRELIRRHLNPKQAVMLTEFDKLKRDYQEHQNEIHSKLVAIMSDRLVVHSRTLETINWEEPSPRLGQPNTYMESLVKEHLTLYKVLSRFLHSETVFLIMSQVFTALDSRLGDEYSVIELKSEEAKERVLVDVRYLQEKLGGLKGLEENGPGKPLETLILAKNLPAKPTTTSKPPPDSSAPALRPPPAAIETPLPTTPSLWTSLPTSASTSALSLALPDAPSTPRTSLDAPPSNYSPPAPSRERNRSPSPGPSLSPVPIPAPLPPSPTPNPATLKKKSLAERLAERMGRKPTEAVPPQQPNLRESGSTLQDVQKKEDERLLEEVQKEIPVWTPKGETELEEIERAIEKEVMAEEAKTEGLGIRSEPSKVEESESKEISSSAEGDHEEEKSLPIDTSEDASTTPNSALDQSPSEIVPQDEPVEEETKESSKSEADHAPAPSNLTINEDTPASISPEPTSEQLVQKAEEDGPTESIEAKEPESSIQELSISTPEATLVIDPPTPEATVDSHSVEILPPSAVQSEPDSVEVKSDLENESLPPPAAESAAPPSIPLPEPVPIITSQSSEPPISSVPTIIIPPTSVPIPPSAPSTPVSSPPQRPSSVTLLPEVSSPPPASTGPVRKKTLKERLAEAARRGSTNNSFVNVTSPPPSARPSLDSTVTKEAKEAKEDIVAKEGKTNGAEPVSVVTTSSGTSSTGAPSKVDLPLEATKEEEKPKENGAEEETKKETIDVEEGSFL
ncbi:hypothetical protein JCM5353_005852 [Sporobolomyces roseus]